LDSINNVSFELEIGIQKKTGYFQEKFAKKKNVIGKEKTKRTEKKRKKLKKTEKN